MIDLIREEFKGSNAEAEFDQILKGESANQYQEAFTFLHGRRGQDVANRIVRTAVWQALDDNNWPSHLSEMSPHNADSATCQSWRLKLMLGSCHVPWICSEICW